MCASPTCFMAAAIMNPCTVAKGPKPTSPESLFLLSSRHEARAQPGAHRLLGGDDRGLLEHGVDDGGRGVDGLRPYETATGRRMPAHLEDVDISAPGLTAGAAD